VQRPKVRVGSNWNDRTCKDMAWYYEGNSGDLYNGTDCTAETGTIVKENDVVRISLAYNRMTISVNGKLGGTAHGIKGEVQLAVQLFSKGDRIELLNQAVPDEEEEARMEEQEEEAHEQWLKEQDEARERAQEAAEEEARAAEEAAANAPEEVEVPDLGMIDLQEDESATINYDQLAEMVAPPPQEDAPTTQPTEEPPEPETQSRDLPDTTQTQAPKAEDSMLTPQPPQNGVSEAQKPDPQTPDPKPSGCPCC